MLTPNLLHGYQQKAVNFQCTRPHSMIWMDTGLGKTSTTLTSIVHLINTGFLKGVLIVAPIRVIRLVWKQEAAKWEHTKHLKFSMVTGSRDQRTRALLRPADVYLVNYENMEWLAQTLETYFIKKDKPMPFNGVVWDEISKMKNSSTNRVKAIKKVLDHFQWTTGLTGTPASNGYKDLHGQFLVVDKGERLGTSKTAFKTRFYKKVGPYKEVAYEDTEDTIKRLIGDVTLEMSAEDYNPLPDLVVNNIELEMPEELRAKYNQMEKEFFMTLDSGTNIEVFNQAALTNKCLQFSNGAMYPVAGMPLWEPIHDLKLEALEEIIDEAQGSPVLCAYAYRSDAERIMKKFEKLRPINLTECKSEMALNNAMHRWKTGDCALMIGHPACLAADTQVMTERNGWVNIIDVKPDDRVHDGIEFVTHEGCSYSGFKEVINVFGICMTPDHKLLINNKWVEAKYVQDSENCRQEATFLWQKNESSSCGMFDLRKSTNNGSSKRSQKQSRRPRTLQSVYIRDVSLNDRNSNLEDMARDEMARQRLTGQKLRWAWNNCLLRMGKFFKILRRYVSKLSRSFNNRKNRREQTLQQGELSLGYKYGTTIQQAQQSCRNVSGRTDTFGRAVPSQWVFQNNVDDAAEQRYDSRSSSCGLSGVTLRQESTTSQHQTERKAHVYDLVNCGPRHRFLIRNSKGEIFISHNSMGHGLDGFQKTGHILVWFGLNWSLELYMQFNARVRRQGQGVPVICHRIMMRDTLDQAQAMALDDKADTQAGLRKAIKEYRLTRGM